MSHPVTSLKKEDVDPIPEKLVPFIRKFMKYASRFNVWIYEKTDGKLGGKFVVGGAPVCLVSYKGRKSGKRLTTPLIHIPHADGVLLVASQGGLESHPLWYKNIKANPTIEVNEFGRVRTMLARQASPEEKLALWPAIRAVHKDFDEYQARTDRDIPVLICTPV
ncbi:MAG: nitroreductase family deazaflavin-dependent oxidoreductase [Polyangiales bacterium]